MSKRDTQFLGFATHLYEELVQNTLRSEKGLSDVEAFKQEQQTIIARRAYDLVTHVLNQTPTGDLYIHYFKDMTEWPDQRAFTDGLADVAKAQEKMSRESDGSDSE